MTQTGLAPVFLFEGSDMTGFRMRSGVWDAATVAAAGKLDLFLQWDGPRATPAAIARRLPQLLPEMTVREYAELTEIYQAAGLTAAGNERPFRAPHHSITLGGMQGSGPRPGEVSLAHLGVLFLDDWREFQRQPKLAIFSAQNAKSVETSERNYPADFMLVFSGQVLSGDGDVIIRLENKPTYVGAFEDSKDLRQTAVAVARCRQRARHLHMFGHSLCNGELHDRELRRVMPNFTDAALPLVGEIQKANRYTVSFRRVLLTIADIHHADYLSEDYLRWALEMTGGTL